jgi:hypothetical protein
MSIRIWGCPMTIDKTFQIEKEGYEALLTAITALLIAIELQKTGA